MLKAADISSGEPLSEVIRAYLAEVAPRSLGGEVVETRALRGDASARRYFRLRLAEGAAVGASALLMEFPSQSQSKPLGSDEVSEGECPITELPFVNVQRHLRHAGVNVPEIYHMDEARGLLLLEDLGDRHLYDVAVDPSERSRRLLYFNAAITQMVRMHEHAGVRVLGDDCTAFYGRMSEKLFMWEFDHFLEYGYEARLDKKLSESLGRETRALFKKISAELADQPRVFTHRDFHSQNILVVDGTVALIDFQDAIMGPAVYDLASLLRDRYFGLDEDEVDAFLHAYREGRTGSVEARMPFDEFRRVFDYQVLQRNMKAAGRFVYLDKVKGKPHLLVHLPNLFASMLNVIDRRRELGQLRELVQEAAEGS